MSKNKVTDEHKKILLLLVIALIVYIPLNAVLSSVLSSSGFDSFFQNLQPVKIQEIKSYLISVGIIPLVFSLVGKYIGIKEWRKLLLLFFIIFLVITTFFIVIA